MFITVDKAHSEALMYEYKKNTSWYQQLVDQAIRESYRFRGCKMSEKMPEDDWDSSWHPRFDNILRKQKGGY